MAGSRRLRPADVTVAASVSETVEALDLKPEDVTATRLAMKYAEAIDAAATLGMDTAAGALERFGPKLLACLVELGATPKARSAALRPSAPQTGSQLAKMRSARTAG